MWCINIDWLSYIEPPFPGMIPTWYHKYNIFDVLWDLVCEYLLKIFYAQGILV